VNTATSECAPDDSVVVIVAVLPACASMVAAAAIVWVFSASGSGTMPSGSWPGAVSGCWPPSPWVRASGISLVT
jgi:hypothetical protein